MEWERVALDAGKWWYLKIFKGQVRRDPIGKLMAGSDLFVIPIFLCFNYFGIPKTVRHCVFSQD